MPLESLLELVETLRGRIDEHGTTLRQNEMRTRYALIDPLLQELSWDTSNPSEVMVEDGSGDGRADYLLLDNNKPVMIIEAKRLGLGVSDGRQQAANYAMDPRRKARYFAATDGNQWEIYDTHQPAISMLIITFSLREDTSAEVCLKALALWRSSAIKGKVTSAESPIIETLPQEEAGATEQHSTANTAPSTSQNVGNWMRLSEFKQKLSELKIQVSEIKDTYGNKPLLEIGFPDGDSSSAEDWNDLTIESIRWLIEKGILRESHCPINVSDHPKSQSIVANTPVHHNKKAFKRGAYTTITDKNGKDFYVFTGFGAHIQVKRCVQVINLVRSGSLAQFKVRLPS